MGFIETLREFCAISIVVRILAAAFLGGIIGSERGRHGRAAGLRTHVLICVGAAMTALTGLYVAEISGDTGDVLRISAQVISGIGFLGAGTILVRNNQTITGLTTAAGIWVTAAIGIAVGYGFYEGAVLATFLSVFSITALTFFERKRKRRGCFYAEVDDIGAIGTVIEQLKAALGEGFTADVVPPKSGCDTHAGILIFLTFVKDIDEVKQAIGEVENIAFVIEANG